MCASRINVDDVSSAQEFEARILVVEDDPEARATLELLLGARWDVTRRRTRRRSRATAARAQPFDLVIANVQMPGLSGIELARLLRADRATQDVSLILMSRTAGADTRPSPASRPAPTTSWSSRSRDASCWSRVQHASRADRDAAPQRAAGGGARQPSAHAEGARRVSVRGVARAADADHDAEPADRRPAQHPARRQAARATDERHAAPARTPSAGRSCASTSSSISCSTSRGSSRAGWSCSPSRSICRRW